MGGHVNWRGAEIAEKVKRASVAGINETLGECVGEAKASHGGWQNRSGTAEGSIQVRQPAALEGARIVGKWGSEGVAYFAHLEFWYGHALTSAADAQYPTLGPRIRRRLA